ncbi:hypothetical protein B9Z65_17 [Elsinoe australis]|uniref:Uncharacterized protein n=1 Tax=Elsinoe australis TaxID=40998 RepID=A0A2P7YWF9_9PEZI|nr:hypothetical protein B9Z65_17 [Elsinoe australis]
MAFGLWCGNSTVPVMLLGAAGSTLLSIVQHAILFASIAAGLGHAEAVVSEAPYDWRSASKLFQAMQILFVLSYGLAKLTVATLVYKLFSAQMGSSKRVCQRKQQLASVSTKYPSRGSQQGTGQINPPPTPQPVHVGGNRVSVSTNPGDTTSREGQARQAVAQYNNFKDSDTSSARPLVATNVVPPQQGFPKGAVVATDKSKGRSSLETYQKLSQANDPRGRQTIDARVSKNDDGERHTTDQLRSKQSAPASATHVEQSTNALTGQLDRQQTGRTGPPPGTQGFNVGNTFPGR